ncbi:HepT-like ribonuclease domain-containing protein [Aphanothece sacrum]|uniref:Nucleotidyltransferase n=1 Tax=Aphanothece sacrum FPU1 TaxID=1920663 RepID=A0A401IN43_APHSA|nr:DUF86 domain-containing protein [Aphanothece sacrum]GBF82656.1 nucleotidyltransferase [Aphanothece sacrum FPU1]GBF84552.1 nucleotidyltransferase [Aphanothece sacrum FPU3]
MMRDNQSLYDILDSAKLAVLYIANKSKQEFLSDLQCQDAVILRIIIIGEASNRISEETQTQFNKLPWRQMIGMRNLVVHQYDDINLNIIWDTVNNDLPKLIRELEKLFETR